MALDALCKLNDSWTQYFAKNPEESPYSKLANLSLITADDAPIFIRTPPRDFLEILTDTSQEQRCFKEQLPKLQVLFLKLDSATLDDAKKKVLQELQERINRLGRHIFVSRQGTICTFIRSRWNRQSDIFSEYQLSYFHELVAPSQIQIGLPNKNAMTCWLNASLMYLAVTTFYDRILLTRLETPAHDALRLSLCRIINALRSNAHHYIIESLQEEVLDRLKKSGFLELLDGEQDASEFLLLLQNRFAPKDTSDQDIADQDISDQIKLITLYSSDEAGIYKNAIETPPSSRLMIRLARGKNDIDIQACLEEQTQKEGITHYEVQEQLQDQASSKLDFDEEKAPKNFTCHDVCLQLPNHLEVYIERGDFNKEVQDATIVPQSIVAPQGYIELIEYRPSSTIVQGKILITGKQAKARCTYQIVAALVHKGQYAAFGHYVTLARLPDGKTITCYSDQTRHSGQDEGVWKDAYLLQLKIVTRQALVAPLPQSDESSEVLSVDSVSDVGSVDTDDDSSHTATWEESDGDSVGPDALSDDSSTSERGFS